MMRPLRELFIPSPVSALGPPASLPALSRYICPSPSLFATHLATPDRPALPRRTCPGHWRPACPARPRPPHHPPHFRRPHPPHPTCLAQPRPGRPTAAPRLTCRPTATRCAGWWAAGSAGRPACPLPGSSRYALARAAPAAACGGRRRARPPPAARTAAPGAPRAGRRSPVAAPGVCSPSGHLRPGQAPTPAGRRPPASRPARQAALSVRLRRRSPRPPAPGPPRSGSRWAPPVAQRTVRRARRMGADQTGPRAPPPPARRPRGPRDPALRRPARPGPPPPPPPRAGGRGGDGCGVRVCVCLPGCCALGCECL